MVTALLDLGKWKKYTFIDHVLYTWHSPRHITLGFKCNLPCYLGFWYYYMQEATWGSEDVVVIVIASIYRTLPTPATMLIVYDTI